MLSHFCTRRTAESDVVPIQPERLGIAFCVWVQQAAHGEASRQEREKKLVIFKLAPCPWAWPRVCRSREPADASLLFLSPWPLYRTRPCKSKGNACRNLALFMYLPWSNVDIDNGYQISCRGSWGYGSTMQYEHGKLKPTIHGQCLVTSSHPREHIHRLETKYARTSPVVVGLHRTSSTHIRREPFFFALATHTRPAARVRTPITTEIPSIAYLAIYPTLLPISQTRTHHPFPPRPNPILMSDPAYSNTASPNHAPTSPLSCESELCVLSGGPRPPVNQPYLRAATSPHQPISASLSLSLSPKLNSCRPLPLSPNRQEDEKS